MNFVFISPHFPHNYHYFCLALKRLGVNVLGIGDAPKREISDSLKSVLTDYYYVSNMEDYDAVMRACAYFTYHYGKIDRIESNNEHWLETDARLRDDFNVLGVRSGDIQRIKFKSFMKEEFRKAGVNVPLGWVVPSMDEALKLVNQVGYPVVAKPDKGVGAVGTYKIKDLQDLQDFFKVKDNNLYIMEEYIEGKMSSFDGLIDHNGNVVFYTVHQYCDNVMDIVHQNLDTAYYSLREIPEDIKDQAFRILKVLNIRARFFHLEFFRCPNNELIALEINMRPPGGMTMDMFNYANDLDMYQQWANIMVFNQFTTKYNWPYHCAFIGRKNRYYHYSHEDILNKYHPFIVYHAPLPQMFWASMGSYGYLVRDANLNKVREIQDFIYTI